MGAQTCVIRHRSSGAPYLVSQHTDMGVINAGDGWHAHPTQALLDIYTLRSRLGELRGSRVVIVGDITHSRVAHSNIWGLTLMDAEVVVCGPPTLLPWGMYVGRDAGEGSSALPKVTVETDLDRAIEGADVVMTLRLQLERQRSGLLPSIREYARLYQVNEERLARAKPGALVMHPGPMIEGVEISPAVARSLQSVIEEQVTNGVAVRMALLYLLARRA
jgi:aspartate carbamoyltransferase catalytic subunit